MRRFVVFAILYFARFLARVFYRSEVGWIGTADLGAIDRIRLVCLLNHTSLFEWLFTMAVPSAFLWRTAAHGVVPAAEKTLRRPIVGWFFRRIAANVVSITRERDHTWRAVLSRIDPDSMVLILPEGRMKRVNGLDANGQPMTVRGGIADILEAIPNGRMLLAYSGGLHHVQAPGERWPRLFQTIRIRFELVEIEDYVRAIGVSSTESAAFKRAVIADLERRRDSYCPVQKGSRGGPEAAPVYARESQSTSEQSSS